MTILNRWYVVTKILFVYLQNGSAVNKNRLPSTPTTGTGTLEHILAQSSTSTHNVSEKTGGDPIGQELEQRRFLRVQGLWITRKLRINKSE